ncbi:MAG TPA: hypothetical protein VGJ18_07945 [Gemmatimonadaceae bacterium]
MLERTDRRIRSLRQNTRAERIANGDPRPSLEERYGDEVSYLRRVEETAGRLVAERLLLPRTRS